MEAPGVGVLGESRRGKGGGASPLETPWEPPPGLPRRGGRWTHGVLGWKTKPPLEARGKRSVSRLNPPGCLGSWNRSINVTELGVLPHITRLHVQEVML